MREGDMQLSVSQIATQIVAQATSLNSVRRKLFLEWLQAHSSRVGCVERSQFEMTAANQQEESFWNHMKSALMTWFESLPAAGVLWEYRLILSELAWWRALDGQSLGMIMDMRDEASAHSGPTPDFSRVLY
jgi:hypothetical protein